MFLEYQLDWIKIVDVLLIAKFLASAIIFASPSSYLLPAVHTVKVAAATAFCRHKAT